MAEPRLYENFDLSIERGRYGYKVRLLSSPVGEASARFRRPFRDTDQILRDLSSADRELDHSEGISKRGTPESVGARLFRSLFTGAVRDRWAAASAGGRPLRIRLRLLPELEDWPWELLYDPDRRVFLAQSTVTPIVRYLEVGRGAPTLQVQPPVRILVVAVSFCGENALDIEREWNILRQALSDPAQVSLDRLDPPTPMALQRKLQQQAYHILHFIGHGSFDQGEGVIELEGEDRQAIRLTGQRLATSLGDQRQLRLVVLNSCSGARTSGRDPFSGVAQGLVAAGLPAVIAMRSRISDRAAIVWSEHFYGALGTGEPVDRAITGARWAVHARVPGLAWSTPVLHMRSPDGRIFEVISPAAPPTQKEAQAGEDLSPVSGGMKWLRTAIALGGGALIASIVAWSIFHRTAPVSDPGCPSPPGLDMPFARISPGTFIMGSASGPKDERPAHGVRITRPYCIGKLEVTQRQWQKIMGSNPSRQKGRDLPVEGISWYEAEEFARRLNGRDPGGRYRLSTEAEWVLAAVKGGGSRNFVDPSHSANCLGSQDGFDKTAPVGSFSPNALGIYDLAGNVSEWVSDWYGLYPAGPVSDYGGPPRGMEKVRRGGDFQNTSEKCSGWYRASSPPARHSERTGLRVVRDVVR